VTEKVEAGTRTLRLRVAGALLLACVAASASPQTAGGATSTGQAPAPAGTQKTGTASASGGSSKSTGTSHTSHTAHNSQTASGKRPSSRRKKTARARGQQKIDSERAQSIQEALIREHYLSGEATGKWNQATEDALRRYQGDHGWQTKTVPDSRALIKLGLGPSHDHLLNPESAMTTTPDAPRAAAVTPAPHSADPGTPTNTNPPPPADPKPVPAPAHDASGPQ
jgi:Putative peptidoglycan binding domain